MRLLCVTLSSCTRIASLRSSLYVISLYYRVYYKLVYQIPNISSLITRRTHQRFSLISIREVITIQSAVGIYILQEVNCFLIRD